MSTITRHAAMGCLVVFLSCAGHADAQTPSRPEALLKKMTLDEKLGQLVQRAGGRSKALNSRLDEAELDRVRAGQVGSYLHVAGAAPLAKLQKVAIDESRLGIPLLFATDVLHGYRTIFPVPLGLAATWAPESGELAARVGAEEATSVGLHWTFAPVLDLTKDTVRYHDLPITPQFAFGHGLSYSEFRYTDLEQGTRSVAPDERIDISITVENAGGVASDEVVQLYIRDPIASIARPVLELRGFKRIELAAGARKRVTFSLTPGQFAFWSSRGQWLVEAGRIDFWIGASSADLRANGSFEITKTHMGMAPAAALATRVIVGSL